MGVERPQTVRRALLSHPTGTALGAAMAQVRSGFVVVVTPTAELDLANACAAPRRIRPHMMERHEPALRASTAVGPRERTAPQVAPPDRALDLGRNVA